MDGQDSFNNEDRTATVNAPSAADCAPCAPFPVFDPERYITHTDGFELSDADRDALLRTLWDFACMLYDAGDTETTIPDILNAMIENASPESTHSAKCEGDQEGDAE